MENVSDLRVLIGNGISVIACIILAISGYVKDKNKTLTLQAVQFSLSALVCIVLRAVSGAVINLLSIPRNILAQKDKLTLPAKIVISALTAVFSVAFNTKGWIGLIPIVPTIIYTFLLDKLNEENFKKLVIFLMAFWTVHDFLIQSYVSTVFNVINMITSAIAIYRIRRDRQRAQTS
ncbi:MAG: YgjV family protein [Oscillospiraceae bacterium]|nr:YgjV family protein [Oscillospiraceae bacterium]